MSNVTLHLASLDDLPEVDRLRGVIDWNPGSWFLRPVMRAGGVVVLAREGQELVAMGSGAHFGKSGFISNMVVRPERQRQGLGAMIFEYLLGWYDEQGIRSIQLEATEAGLPLYERYGFRVRWESITGELVESPSPPDGDGVRLAADSDWLTIAELDRRAAGCDRTRTYRGIDAREALVYAPAGNVLAYGLRHEDRVGPVIAASEASASILARAMLSRSSPGTRVAIGHPMHASFWENLGVHVGPYDVRMALGPEPADDPTLMFAMLNGGIG